MSSSGRTSWMRRACSTLRPPHTSTASFPARCVSSARPLLPEALEHGQVHPRLPRAVLHLGEAGHELLRQGTQRLGQERRRDDAIPVLPRLAQRLLAGAHLLQRDARPVRHLQRPQQDAGHVPQRRALVRERVQLEHVTRRVRALVGLQPLRRVLHGGPHLGDADAPVLVRVDEGEEARVAVEPLDRAGGGEPLRLRDADGLHEHLEGGNGDLERATVAAVDEGARHAAQESTPPALRAERAARPHGARAGPSVSAPSVRPTGLRIDLACIQTPHRGMSEGVSQPEHQQEVTGSGGRAQPSAKSIFHAYTDQRRVPASISGTSCTPVALLLLIGLGALFVRIEPEATPFRVDTLWGLRTVRKGMSPQEVQAILGQPTSKERRGNHGVLPVRKAHHQRAELHAARRLLRGRQAARGVREALQLVGGDAGRGHLPGAARVRRSPPPRIRRPPGAPPSIANTASP